MKAKLFAQRNAKEILRDPLNLFFGLGFPLVLIGLFAIINASIPPEANNTMFAVSNTAPGLAIFGTSFLALFVGVLSSKDRTTSFLMRLFTSPMKSGDFLLGYTLPMAPMAVAQAMITLAAGCALGLPLSPHMLPALCAIALISLLFVGFGLLCGALLPDKAVGGICGALLANICGWFSGVFIPLDLIGGAFKAAAEILPFFHAVEAVKMVLRGDYYGMIPHMTIVLAYTAVIYALAVLVFRWKMRGDRG